MTDNSLYPVFDSIKKLKGSEPIKDRFVWNSKTNQ